MPKPTYVILRSARRARLEGRKDRRAALFASSREPDLSSPRRGEESLYGRSALCVDVDEFLDAQPVLDALDHLVRVEIDADRVFVAGRAPAHVVLALDRGLEIVDQQLDLVAIGVVIVHRGRDPVIDAAMRLDPLTLQVPVLVGQIAERAHREGDVM